MVSAPTENPGTYILLEIQHLPSLLPETAALNVLCTPFLPSPLFEKQQQQQQPIVALLLFNL